MFLLVFDLRSANHQALRNWFLNISTPIKTNKKPIVFVAATHADDFPSLSGTFNMHLFVIFQDAEETLERVMLHFKEFSSFTQGSFAVSNKTGTGLDILKKAIVFCAQQRLSKIQVPLAYVTLAHLIEQRAIAGEKILFWKDIQELSTHCELKDSDAVYNALEFLHQTGLMVFIPNVTDTIASQESKLVVISDPQVSSSVLVCLY